MSTMVRRLRHVGWSNLALAAKVRGADLALQVPLLRNYLLDRLVERLSRSYDQLEEDRVLLAHQRWFAGHLRTFLHRLVAERPAAARAMLRFVGTWIRDMRRRVDAQKRDGATPCTVVIEPTDRCNLNCPGCYAKSTRDGSDLPYQRLVEIVRQVVDMGVTLVTLSAGEPFLRERADRCVTRLAEDFPDRGFLVYTNGTMIDRDVARRLGQVGNVFPAISVEGFEHQTNARRGPGVYQQNRRARECLAEYGVMTGFSATVTSRNADSICTDEFIELRIAEGDLFGWFFLLQPIGRAPRTDLMPSAEQRARLRETVYRWRQEDRPIFLGDFWNDGHLVGGCIAGGRYYFHIRADGDISPCVFAPVACGNVLDIIDGRSRYRSLDEFVQDSPVFRAFRREQQRVTDRDRPCLLIDHPAAARRCAALTDCRPGRNLPEGYFDGPIARTIDRLAREWEDYCRTRLPPLPAGNNCQLTIADCQS